MLNTPSDGVVFSPKDQDRLNLLERRLLNFQEEITTAKKNLADVTSELSKVTREKEYQADLLGAVSQQVSEKQATLEKLHSDIVKSTSELESNKDEAAKAKMYTEAAYAGLKEKADIMEKREAEHAIKVADFTRNSSQLDEDRASVNHAQKVISEAVGQISWLK